MEARSDMCVAVPGRITALGAGPGPTRPAQVVFPDGSHREVDLAILPDASVGEYVVVHSGFAVAKVSEQSALESYRLFEEPPSA